MQIEINLREHGQLETLDEIYMPCAPFIGMNIQLSNNEVYCVSAVQWVVVNDPPGDQPHGYFACDVYKR